MSAVTDRGDFTALEPFFRVIEDAAADQVDGTHFFDMIADDAVFEYVITVPGYPRRVIGRDAVAELYRPYGQTFFLDGCVATGVHRDRDSGVVVIEYESQGRVVGTGDRYSNHYISVLTIRAREIVHWRDYLDPIAVFDAIGWPKQGA